MSEVSTNKFEAPKISTYGMTLFDKNGLMLKLAYLDESLSMLLCEPTVVDGKKTYPQDKRHPFLVTMPRANTLLKDIIVNRAIPNLENGVEKYRGGVFLNNSKTQVLEIGIDKGDIYLIYHKDIDEDLNPKLSLAFKFEPTEIIENFNPETKKFEISQTYGNFLLFCKYVEAGIYDIHGSASHALNLRSNYKIERAMKMFKAIALKLGVEVTDTKKYTPANSGFNLSSQSVETPASLEINETSMEDMLPF